MSYFLFKPPFRLVQGNKIPRTSIVIVEKQVQSSQVLSEKGNTPFPPSHWLTNLTSLF